MSKVAERIHAYLEPLTDQQKFCGSILASKNGHILFSSGFGKANFELAVDNTPKTKFRIGSITKTFTAVSILQLVQKGQLDLEDPISNLHIWDQALHTEKLLSKSFIDQMFSPFKGEHDPE